MNKVNFLYQLLKLWRLFGTQRLGQLISNLIAFHDEGIDLFYLEDKKLLDWIVRMQNKDEWTKIISNFNGFKNEKK